MMRYVTYIRMYILGNELRFNLKQEFYAWSVVLHICSCLNFVSVYDREKELRNTRFTMRGLFCVFY